MASGKVDVLAFIGTSKGADALKRSTRNRTGFVPCWAGGEEPGYRPARRRPGPGGQGMRRSGALSFNGQRCTAIKMIFVHERSLDEFLERFSAAMDAAQAYGMPWEPGVTSRPCRKPGKAGVPAGAGGRRGCARARGL